MNTFLERFTRPYRSARISRSLLVFSFSASLVSCEPTPVAQPAAVFEGTYTVTEGDATQSYQLVIRKTEKTNAYTIENLGNVAKTPLECTANQKVLTIPEQTIPNDALGRKQTIYGTGTLDSKILILRYSVQGPSGYNGVVYARQIES